MGGTGGRTMSNSLRLATPFKSTPEPTDEALMEAYRDGDPSAFETLYARHRRPLYHYIRRQVNGEYAEELYQDVWMRLIAARDRYTVSAKFTTYLYRIARNRLIDHYRAGDRHQQDISFDEESIDEALPLSPGSETPDTAMERSQTALNVREALQRLPKDQLDTFLLHEEAGLTLEEIAQLNGIGRETVKSRLRYALGKLRRALETAE